MNNKPLDLTKPVRTRAGEPVTIIKKVDKRNRKNPDFPIIGIINHQDGEESIECWTLNGDYSFGGHDDERDITNTTQPNTYRMGRFCISTRLFKEWESLLPLFSQMAVTDAKYNLDNDEVEYTAYSPLFNEVENIIPMYRITIQKDPPIITAVRI